ncbi:protein POLLENLESS 3-LIKE 2 [Magnolia sinica]|uniref:protein POLLENLESS 3-LIKE 2 n=1 Tax=Magnolia sinica TaxID=86752 RepID=UPI002657F528|nr:protein POLLENLESS 3-LIKE 2 [Magnolia sinica]
MMQDLWNAPLGTRPSKSAPCSPVKPLLRTRSESFHVAHKVPIGDTPYVKAKQVQLVDKDPEKAIALFWAAINAGDRVDSALKDMAIVMKQQNRAEEAIEAIKSLRARCSEQAQESLDNILLDLYKRCGRLDDQIALLKHKLYLIQQGMAFNGKRTKTARSQGKKFQVSVEQEATRLLGNLGWAFMQQQNYVEAEAAYRRALTIAPDNNKMCNLGICLMKQGRITEAKETLRQVKPAMADGPRGVDSHLKAFERAQEMLQDLESELMNNGQDQFKQTQLFNAFLGSSSIWEPQPCKDPTIPFVPNSSKPHDDFPDENFDVNRINRGAVDNRIQPCPLQKFMGPAQNSLNSKAPPFYSKLIKDTTSIQFHDLLGGLKRTRSSCNNAGPINKHEIEKSKKPPMSGSEPLDHKARRRSLSSEEIDKKWIDLLPDSEALDDAIMAAVLAPVLETTTVANTTDLRNLNKKRLKVFQDITLSLSPRA